MKARIERKGLVVSSLLVLAIGLGFGADASAQRQKVSYQVPAADTKYTKQYSIEVGDIPGHEIRIYEIYRTVKDGPKIEGVRLMETWSRGYSNYVEMNGPSSVYTIMVMENGDRIFGHVDLISQSTEKNPDGSFKSAATVSGLLTGGTGKFLGIRGLTRTKVVADIKSGANAAQTEVEYWMVK